MGLAQAAAAVLPALLCMCAAWSMSIRVRLDVSDPGRISIEPALGRQMQLGDEASGLMIV